MALHPLPAPGEEIRGLQQPPGQFRVLQQQRASPSTSPPSPPSPAGPQFRCTSPTPVDMIFLVDGSWSIGHSHFQQVKDFLASIIEPFEIGPDRVQVGGSQPCPAPHPGWSSQFLPAPSTGDAWKREWELEKETRSLWELRLSSHLARQGWGPHLPWRDSRLLGARCVESEALQMCLPGDPGEAVCVLPACCVPTPPSLTQYSGDPSPSRPDSVQRGPPDRVGPECLWHQGGGAGRRAWPPLQRGKHVHRSAWPRPHPRGPFRSGPEVGLPRTLPDLGTCVLNHS